MAPPARILVYGLALLAVARYGFIAAHTWAYPHQLEWMEGAMFEVVARMEAGLPVYVAPTVDWVAPVYPPLYFVVTRAVAGAVGLDLWVGRLVSLLSSLGVAVVLCVVVTRRTRDPVWGATAVGLWFTGYELSGRFHHLVRVDALAVFLLALALAVLTESSTRRSAVLAGLLLAAAAGTKQTMLLIGLPCVAAHAWVSPTRAAVAAAVSVVAPFVAFVAGTAASGGWLAYYLFDLPSSHPWDVGNGALFLARHLRPLLPAVAWAILSGWGSRRHATAADARARIPSRTLFGASLVAAFVTFVRTGSDVNALMPLLMAVAWTAPLGLARLCAGRPWTPALAIAMTLLPLVQLPGRSIPAREDARGAQALLDFLRAQTGEVLVPDLGFLQTRVGKASHGLGMSARDVLRAPRMDRGRRMLERSLAEALGSRRFPTVVLSERDWLGGVVALTHVPAGELVDVPAPVAGYPMRPRFVYRLPGVATRGRDSDARAGVEPPP